jgi:hypothetical protein
MACIHSYVVTRVPRLLVQLCRIAVGVAVVILDTLASFHSIVAKDFKTLCKAREQ